LGFRVQVYLRVKGWGSRGLEFRVKGLGFTGSWGSKASPPRLSCPMRTSSAPCFRIRITTHTHSLHALQGRVNGVVVWVGEGERERREREARERGEREREIERKEVTSPFSSTPRHTLGCIFGARSS